MQGNCTIAAAFGRSSQEAESNAKLIAAAPDMLEALKEVSEMLIYHKLETSGVFMEVQNAIKKATL